MAQSEDIVKWDTFAVKIGQWAEAAELDDEIISKCLLDGLVANEYLNIAQVLAFEAPFEDNEVSACRLCGNKVFGNEEVCGLCARKITAEVLGA